VAKASETLNIYLGFYVDWDLKEGAYCFAISGLDYGWGNIKYHEPVAIPDSTPPMLALLGLAEAIRTTGTQIAARSAGTLQVNVFASTNDIQALGGIRKVMSQIRVNLSSKADLPDSHYSSKNSDLMVALEKTGTSLWQGFDAVKIKVNKYDEKLRAGKLVWSAAKTAVGGVSSFESPEIDISDQLEALRRGN
jgi:hypothetical protein